MKKRLIALALCCFFTLVSRAQTVTIDPENAENARAKKEKKTQPNAVETWEKGTWSSDLGVGVGVFKPNSGSTLLESALSIKINRRFSHQWTGFVQPLLGYTLNNPKNASDDVSQVPLALMVGADYYVSSNFYLLGALGVGTLRTYTSASTGDIQIHSAASGTAILGAGYEWNFLKHWSVLPEINYWFLHIRNLGGEQGYLHSFLAVLNARYYF